MTGNEWQPRLVELLGAPDIDASGAELYVTNRDDNPDVFRAPLARHWRYDPAPNGPTLWLRPLPEPYQHHDVAGPVFSLAAARRRSLDFTAWRADGDQLVFDLVNGQRAHLRAVGDDLRPQLEQWDDFVCNTLEADTVRVLEQLAEDSWWGPFA